jgi:hypothetical protein
MFPPKRKDNLYPAERGELKTARQAPPSAQPSSVAAVRERNRGPLGRIVSLPTQGRAPQQPPANQNRALRGSELPDGLHPVLGAGGDEATRWREQRRDGALVEANGCNHGGRHRIRLAAVCTGRRSVVLGIARAFCLIVAVAIRPCSNFDKVRDPWMLLPSSLPLRS